MKTINILSVSALLASSLALTSLTSACSQQEEPTPVSQLPQPSPSSAATASSSTVRHDVDLTLLPTAARRYVEATNARNLDSLVAAFDTQGGVLDVSRRIQGRPAIRTWANNEVIGGSLRVIEINQQSANRVRLLVHWAPSGSTGWRAWYTFEHRNGLITLADLQYA